MYNIPNINAYIPDAILNKIGSVLLHFIDSDKASKFVTKSASKNINKNPSYQTIKAFEKFDLTFLVHSSLEKGKSLSLTWLEKIGLTTENLISTRVSRK